MRLKEREKQSHVEDVVFFDFFSDPLTSPARRVFILETLHSDLRVRDGKFEKQTSYHNVCCYEGFGPSNG
jgi:hypothetical protein